MKAYERLLKYVVVRTPSDEESGKSPSSECQFKLAGLLKDEMTELGLSDVKLDKHCYLYGRLPATKGLEKLPSIGFIAHANKLIRRQANSRIITVSDTLLEELINLKR